MRPAALSPLLLLAVAAAALAVAVRPRPGPPRPATAAVEAGSVAVDKHDKDHHRYPHMYHKYGWLYGGGYDYYSLATLAVLKFKAVIIVAVIFLGLVWWYGLYGGMKNGAYGGYAAQHSGYTGHYKCADHDLHMVRERDDPVAVTVTSAPTVGRPSPLPPPLRFLERVPAPTPAAARSAPGPGLLPGLVRGLELADLSFGVLGPPGPGCRRRLACELGRLTARLPLLGRAALAAWNPFSLYLGGSGFPVTPETNCTALYPECKTLSERSHPAAPRNSSSILRFHSSSSDNSEPDPT